MSILYSSFVTGNIFMFLRLTQDTLKLMKDKINQTLKQVIRQLYYFHFRYCHQNIGYLASILFFTSFAYRVDLIYFGLIMVVNWAIGFVISYVDINIFVYSCIGKLELKAI